SSAFSFACSPGLGGGPSGDPHCMAPILANDPYYNGSMNQQQTPVVVHIPSKYGALALNKKTGISGGAIQMDSLSRAKKEAIKKCENGGKNAPCTIVQWVRNGCIAAARGIKTNVSNNPFISFFDAGKVGEAEKKAMTNCRASGASNCEIYISEACSLP
ncbi:MAG: DUF4189 domain-containing protein, partial [Neisseria mucosa]|nr:DUF4189 domain-containing protein [Neisseria mucosa]